MAQNKILSTEIWGDRTVEEVFGRDPIVRFEESVAAPAMEIDTRSDQQLGRDGLTHPDPTIREHSLYQLAYRQGPGALAKLEEALATEKDSQVRVNLLWLLQEVPDERCRKIALSLLHDRDHRVQEWARVFCWEMRWTSEDFRRPREATYYPGRTFDETVFLHIKCHLFVRLTDTNQLWGHVYLSPRMLARIYGQALACPVTETRERVLVLSKTLEGLHEDGSPHYESFCFRGFTERASRLQGNFYFEAHTKRPVLQVGQGRRPLRGGDPRGQRPLRPRGTVVPQRGHQDQGPARD